MSLAFDVCLSEPASDRMSRSHSAERPHRAGSRMLVLLQFKELRVLQRWSTRSKGGQSCYCVSLMNLLQKGGLSQRLGSKQTFLPCCQFCYHKVFVVQSLSHVRLFATPWTATCQTSLSFTISQSLLKLMYIELMMPSNQLILCRSLLLLSSVFPSIRVFSNELAFWIRWPKYSASASVLPVSIQGWFPLGLTGLIFLLSKWLSRVFFSTTVQKHHFFSTQASLWPNSQVCDWKNHNFDYTNLCWQTDVSAF